MSKLIAKIKSFIRANEHEMDYLMSLCEKDSSAVSPSLSMLLFSWKLHNQRKVSSSNNSAQINGMSRFPNDADKRLRFLGTSDIEGFNNRPVGHFLEAASN